jgi:hypothetical protein
MLTHACRRLKIGADTQEKFTAWAERELLPVLRSL